MSFTTTTKVTYPDGTVQETTTTSTKSKWAPMHDDNFILLTDSYKLTHYKQYPPGSEYVYSYFESRGGKWDDVCFFGLQYFLKRYLSGPVRTVSAARAWRTSEQRAAPPRTPPPFLPPAAHFRAALTLSRGAVLPLPGRHRREDCPGKGFCSRAHGR
jgi:hypothetical protein